MSYDRYGVNTRNSFNTNPTKKAKTLQSKMTHAYMTDYKKNYERAIYMSEYTPINREHHRRIRNCMVVSLGINIFLLLVMVLR